MSRLGIAGALSLLVLACAGCSTAVGVPQACSAVGAATGVFVDVSAMPAAAHVGNAKLCVNTTTCKQQILTTDTLRLQVNDPSLQYGQTVTVTLLITDSTSGRKLLDDTAKAQVGEIAPNGSSCAPTAYQAELAVGADGRLQPESVG